MLQFTPMGAQLMSSINWWETATITTTVLAAIVQSLSWIFSFFDSYTKGHRNNRTFLFFNRRIRFEKTSLKLAGAAALLALVGALFSIEYARLTDRDSLEVHRQIVTAQNQAASAAEVARQSSLELTQTKGHLAAVTQQLANAEQELAAAREFLQLVDKQQKWGILVMRMNADDAAAYDALRESKSSADPIEVLAVKSALQAVFESHNSETARSKRHPLERHIFTLEEATRVLDVGDSYNRAAAIETLMTLPPQPSLVPKLVSMSLSDASLDVRTAAIFVINAWTTQRFRALDKKQVLDWWNIDGKKDYPSTLGPQ